MSADQLAGRHRWCSCNQSGDPAIDLDKEAMKVIEVANEGDGVRTRAELHVHGAILVRELDVNVSFTVNDPD
jgi:hypothetical protein